MDVQLRPWAAVLALVLVCSAVTCGAESDRAKSGEQLPKALAGVLSQVKAKSQVPVLLPSELPETIAEAKHALVDKASAKGYSISLWYETNVGYAGFAAMFSAEAAPDYSPRELPGTHEVKLVGGISGYSRPVSCGGSCAPANIWWEEKGVLYQIQLNLSSTLSEEKQEEFMVGVANSAIAAGSR